MPPAHTRYAPQKSRGGTAASYSLGTGFNAIDNFPKLPIAHHVGKRGLAALPSWDLKNYLDHGYVVAKRIGRGGLWSDLYATGPKVLMRRRFAQDMVRITREQCAAKLNGIELLD